MPFEAVAASGTGQMIRETFQVLDSGMSYSHFNISQGLNTLSELAGE